MSGKYTHKCDMYCRWEDLEYSDEKCKNCIYNRWTGESKWNDNRIDNNLPDTCDHLWRKQNHMTYDQYKKWLEIL